jgi:hydroxymethylbilane synthase
LGIEIRADRTDLLETLAPLNHIDTEACVLAERAFSRALAGSCTVPLGAYATTKNNEIHITGFVASVDGKQMLRENIIGLQANPDAVGRTLAEKLISRGADKILSELDHIK